MSAHRGRKLDGFQFGTVAEAVLPDGSQAFWKGYPRQVLTAVESPGIVGAGSESLDITGQCDLLKIGLAGEVHRKFGRGEGSFTQVDDRTVCEVACNRGELFGREGRFAQGNDFQVADRLGRQLFRNTGFGHEECAGAFAVGLGDLCREAQRVAWGKRFA